MTQDSSNPESQPPPACPLPDPALLPGIKSPEDVQNLSEDQLEGLAAEIRDTLIRSLANTGGHLGPNPVSYTHLTLPTIYSV